MYLNSFKISRGLFKLFKFNCPIQYFNNSKRLKNELNVLYFIIFKNNFITITCLQFVELLIIIILCL